jgi:hypothetical protein
MWNMDIVLILLGVFAAGIIWSWASAWNNRHEDRHEQEAFAYWKHRSGYGPARRKEYDPMYKSYVAEKHESARRRRELNESLDRYSQPPEPPEPSEASDPAGVSIRCGHCSGHHATVKEVRSCASNHPVLTEEPPDAALDEHRPEAGRDIVPFHCGVMMLPIVWGMPPPNAAEIEKREGIIFGMSCRVGPHNPRWACPVCGRRTGARISRSYTTRTKTPEPDPPWRTKVRMWVQYRLTGDV